jgi:universal stress protein A
MADYKHILVAVDLSVAAEAIIAKAHDISRRNKARLSLLHVVEYQPPIYSDFEPVVAAGYWQVDDSIMLEHAKESLERVSKKCHLQDVEMKVLIGIPRHEIAQFVKSNNCDLVVLGSHGRHGISVLLGSTANAVLHDMPCDVLTVKI